jgi:phosphatidylinositol alpha-mannosyltransferase
VVRAKANGSTAPIGLNLVRARAFARHCEQVGVDVVHVHEPLAPVASWPPLWRHRIPIVATFHRSGIDALSRAAGLVLGPLIRRIDDPVAVSEAASSTIRATCRIQPEVLFNGVSLPSPGAREPWPKDGPTILFIGRDEPRKGRDVLLAAATRLPESITVWVTGAPPAAPAHRGARVEYLGTISESEKLRRLQATDVLCAPSLGGESFGLVLLEGLASGATVVASDIDGYRQALGDHGMLVEPNDPVRLADALMQALSGERGLERPAVDRYLSRWSMDSLAVAYEDRYRVLAGFKPVNRPE